MNKWWCVCLIVFSQTSMASLYIYENTQGKQIVTGLPSTKAGLYLIYSSESTHALGLKQKIPLLDFDNKLISWVKQASDKHAVPAPLIYAVIQQESNFKQNATSSKGAIGLMQLMPKTAHSYGLYDIYDPKKNIDIGTKHLKRLLTKYQNDITLSLAAYNAGEGNVKKFKGIPPFNETKNYITKVKQFYLIAQKNNSLL